MGRIIIRRFILGGKGNVGSLHCIVVEIDATERLLDAAQRSGSFARLQLAFPHLDYVPTHTPQLHPVPGIARLIALNLLPPEAGICLRQAEISAPLMPMPETSVYENHRTVERARSCDSGIPGKTGSGAPSFPDACRGCGCATCSDAVARLSLCQPY